MTLRSSAARVAFLGLALVAAVVAGCTGTTGNGATVTFPAGSIGPDRTVSPAMDLTRATLFEALGAQQLVLQDTDRPFRPPEGPMLAGAPRAIYQVILPQDPDQGFIVAYEFLDPSQATQAAQEQAAYLASGPGRVNFPIGAVHVIRVVGTAVVLYSWIPEGAEDPAAPRIQEALETVGLAVPVPG
jgi:hypothetical protein